MSNPPKPPGCDKNIDGDQLASLRDVSTDDMKALINSHANDKCRNELLNSLQSTVDRGSTTATWIEEHAGGSVGWTGGSANIGASAGRNTTNNDRIDEDSRTSAITEGCRQTLYNMNNSNTLYSQLACNMKAASNTIDSDIKMGASISIIVGPTEAMVAQHERHLARLDATILAIASKNPVTKVDVELMKEARQAADDAISKFRFDVRNSNFRITSNNIQNLKTTNNQAIDDNTKVKEAITKKATAEAVTAITQKYELGAGAVANLESYAGTKINDSSLTTAMDIIAAANDTKIEVDQQGNITLRVNGSLDGINVDITQGNLTELRSELVMKAATTLGRDIANEIIHEQSTKTEAQIEALGLASLQKAIADGLAAQAKSMEQPDMFGGGGLFGGMFGKIAMFVIPIIIILVLFSMFGFKIALVAGLLFGIYLAIAYFVGLPPFSKEKSIGYYLDLTNDIDYQDWLGRIVVPRREAYLTALRNRLNAERDRAFGNEYTSYDYGQQLNSALSFLDTDPDAIETLKRVKLLTLMRPSGSFSGSPKWFQTAIYRLEYQIWVDVYGIFEALSYVRNSSEVTVNISPSSLETVRKEKDKVQSILNTMDAQIRENDWDSNMFNVIVNLVIADVGHNQPESWRSFLEDANAVLDRTRAGATRASMYTEPMAGGIVIDTLGPPMAGGSSASYPMTGGIATRAMDNQQAVGPYGQGYAMAAGTAPKAMDNQQAVGTFGQGYPMADIQQAYVAAQPQIVESVTQARPHRVQKSYTNSDKKKAMYSMKKMQNAYDNTDISKKGYETRVANMIQREYSRNRDSIKPAYNKLPVFKK